MWRNIGSNKPSLMRLAVHPLTHENGSLTQRYAMVLNQVYPSGRKWLSRKITRYEKPENFKQALGRKPDDIKVVVQFAEA